MLNELFTKNTDIKIKEIIYGGKKREDIISKRDEEYRQVVKKIFKNYELEDEYNDSIENYIDV